MEKYLSNGRNTFPSAKLQRNNEIPNQSNLLGLRTDRKYHISARKLFFFLIQPYVSTVTKVIVPTGEETIQGR